MAVRRALYRYHLFSFGGPQTKEISSRWTYDLVPANDFELRSGTLRAMGIDLWDLN
jgi:hypothetical protein